MKIRLAIILSIAVLATVTACKKKNRESIGGKGGNATINAVAKHHNKNVDSCTIYIKYNTNDLPSPDFNPNQYDEAVKCVSMNGEPTASFTGLKKGKYYLYGVGYDPSIASVVVAGKPFTITEDGSTNRVVVPVTEGD